MNNVLSVLIGIILVWLAFKFIGGLAALILGVVLLIVGVKYILKGF